MNNLNESLTALVRLLFIEFTLLSASAMANPCTKLEVTNTEHQTVATATAVALDLGLSKVEIQHVFVRNKWTVVSFSSQESDDGFAFYLANPSSTQKVAVWGGAALPTERPALSRWAQQNAPGIPLSLANCFAWAASGGVPAHK